VDVARPLHSASGVPVPVALAVIFAQRMSLIDQNVKDCYFNLVGTCIECRN
jgi:hypothetical protein